MIVDTDKIKVGDEIVARITVDYIFPSGSFRAQSKSNTSYTKIRPEHIIEHIPAPVEPKAGVKFKGQNGVQYKILAEFNDLFWIEGDDFQNEKFYYTWNRNFVQSKITLCGVVED